MLGIALTHWTIRLALVCLTARLVAALLDGERRRFQLVRNLWTAGCVCFLAHVACAFYFYHHGRHSEAFETTAQRTQEMLGMRFGEGIYFSYLFGVSWLLDVAWQWISPRTYQERASAASRTLLVYMAFIAFNGAVVFEGGVTRWFGVPITVGLVWLMIARLRNTRAMGVAEREPIGPTEQSVA